jgi:hypothetical protein
LDRVFFIGTCGLANKNDPQMAPLDVNNVVGEVIGLLQREWVAHQVMLQLELAPATQSGGMGMGPAVRSLKPTRDDCGPHATWGPVRHFNLPWRRGNNPALRAVADRDRTALEDRIITLFD